MSPTPGTVVYRVGVTGHRTHDLEQADRTLLLRRIGEVLDSIRRSVANAAPGGFVRLISPLAEGADRLVASEALDLGFDLQCPFPFPAGEYGSDARDPASAAEFESLAARASATFEMNGAREDGEEAAYEAVGRLVLRNVDLLIAIWDGKPARGRGGTAQMVSEAEVRGIPVFWIHSHSPHPCRLLASGAVPESDTLESLASLVAAQLSTPRPDVGEPGGTTNPATCFAWADREARRYAVLYRSTFRLNCLLAAAAVLCALLTYHYPEAHGWTIAELALMVVVAASVWLGTRRQWHSRWLNFRALAEHARVMQWLAPFAGTLSLPRYLPHQAPDGARREWLEGHVRSLVRAAGLPCGSVTPAYIGECRRLLGAKVREQIDYHERTARRARRVHLSIERISLGLFGLTLIACVLHLRTGEPLFTLVSAFGPVLGAAAAAIVVNGEFGRVAQRSAAMARRLGELARDLEKPGISFARMADMAESAADVMLAELLDWDILFRARPLALPN